MKVTEAFQDYYAKAADAGPKFSREYLTEILVVTQELEKFFSEVKFDFCTPGEQLAQRCLGAVSELRLDLRNKIIGFQPCSDASLKSQLREMAELMGRATYCQGLHHPD